MRLSWLAWHRYQHKLKVDGDHSTLSDERERKLESVGFLWSAQQALWETRFMQLLEYKAQFGNCNVPSRSQTHPKLCVWVKSQRRQYKLRQVGSSEASITPERIRRLNDIGFVWKPRGERE